MVKIRDSNKWDQVRPAFTCDLWRSRTRREYFTLTMHYIDIRRGDSGTQWLLRSRILGSVPVQAVNIDHEGDQQCQWPAVYAGHFMLWAFIMCGCFTVACNVAFPIPSPYVCHAAVVVGLARQELKKYNLVGWLPTFVSDAGSNVRRALAGRITRDKFREGGNMADWGRCVCHLLHNVVTHGLRHVDVRATNSLGPRKLSQALQR